MSDTTSGRNRLAQETSPYLLQHADNPVDWYPWGDEALAAARREAKPILLSIGYSACHWCHVMAHESFEDPDVAALMNALYINVKVDREERPDIDKIYQTAHQLIAQRPGGWPLTMFLTPDEQLPFFGGTYFPKEARHGMPAFPDILQRVAAYYAGNRDEASQQGRALANVFSELEAPAPGDGLVLDRGPIDAARDTLERNFDREFGGFGNAPKFPNTPSLERLLQHWRATASSPEPDLQALFMPALALTRMAEGGIQDHVGGGFCRYAVDRAWQIPHFEKMLYDNALLLPLYAELWLSSGDALMRDTATRTADWMLRELRSPGGGFYSSYDADSEGEEGAFYVWQRDAVRQLVGDEHFPAFAARYGLDQPPNFEGAWHLSVRRGLDELAAEHGIEAGALADRLEAARQRLFEARERRTRPGLDDKILTSWNALAVRGLAIAGRALQRDDYVDAAAAGLAFIRRELWDDERLAATWKDGRARLNAYLDDYAFTLDAALELLQCRWEPAWFGFAETLARVLIERFEDGEHGGFYFTSNDHEHLLHRGRGFADDALPSGNAVAARALLRLAALGGEPRFTEAAERTLRAGWRPMLDYPHGHASLISALDEWLCGTEIVVIRGAAKELAAWTAAASALYAPHRMVLPVPADATDLPEPIALRAAQGDAPVAYVCRGTTCTLPMTSWQALSRELAA